MKNNLKKSTVAAAIAFALTASISFSAHAVIGTTLGDLTAVATADQTQTGFDTAIKDIGSEFETNYNTAMAGSSPTLAMSSAVILQSTAGDNNFAYINQEATAITPATTAFNYAAIDQQTGDNNAYILQSGDQNYASIVQGGAQASVAYISQLGNSNRAIINQK
jgi:hypothetical protein